MGVIIANGSKEIAVSASIAIFTRGSEATPFSATVS